jgi:hypothetical protein
MNIQTNIDSVKKIYMSDSALSMLMDFERVLDSLDIYAFPNWKMGELVEGPMIKRYWVTCKFMWPRDRMPDPRGGQRLLPYGARITYEKTSVKMPVKIENPGDFRPGSHKGKLVDVPIWYVDITLPKGLLADIKQGSKDIAGEEVDLTDLQDSYDKNFQQQSLTGGGQQALDLGNAAELGAGLGAQAAGGANAPLI